MSWDSEFDRSYEVPAFVDFLVRENLLTDLSWHNDVAPSFGVYLDHPEREDFVRFWVEHTLREYRENPESPRFGVSGGSTVGTPDVDESFDGFEEALEFFFDEMANFYRRNPEVTHAPGWANPQEFLRSLIERFAKEQEEDLHGSSIRRWRLR